MDTGFRKGGRVWVKGPFHEPMNPADERQKKTKTYISVTNLIGRQTSAICLAIEM